MEKLPRAAPPGGFAEGYMPISAASLFSGLNGVERNIIASRGLGLPQG